MQQAAGEASLYEAAWVVKYFDEFAEKEWARHDVGVADEVRYQLHLDMLDRYLRPGMRVLEIGAGPGRFTQVLVQRQCKVRRAHLAVAPGRRGRCRDTTRTRRTQRLMVHAAGSVGTICRWWCWRSRPCKWR